MRASNRAIAGLASAFALLLTACGPCPDGTFPELSGGACACEDGTELDVDACLASDGGNAPADPAVACSGVNEAIAGTIQADTTWKRGSICLLVGDLLVAEGATLTIEEGVVVKSGGSGRGGWYPLLVEGALEVRGTEASSVVFTSVVDDARGGDTNGDDGGTAPSASNWGGIAFRTGATGTIEHAEIRFASDGVWTEGSSPTLRDLDINHCANAISSLPADEPVIEGLVAEDSAVNGQLRRAGVLGASATWSQSAAVQVLGGDVTVPEGATLTIGEGVIIKSGANGRGAWNPLLIDGTLHVAGTAASPVVFTSRVDDTRGGDTNGDAGGTTPVANNWGGIVFRSGSTGTVEHAEIRYASDGVRTENASPTLRDVDIDSCENAVSSLPTDQPIIDGFVGERSAVNGVLRRAGVIGRDTTWNQPDAVVVLGGDVTIAEGAELTVEQGVIVKSGTNGRGDWYPLVVEGGLDVRGTAAAPVVFTSRIDDTRGGDTNGDAGGTSPGAENWGGIVFEAGASGTIDHAEIRYATNGLRVDGASPSVTASIIELGTTGIRAVGAASPAIAGSTIRDNANGATSEPTASVDARNNYWGAADGPSGDGPGSGDPVTGNVSFEPFLTAEP